MKIFRTKSFVLGLKNYLIKDRLIFKQISIVSLIIVTALKIQFVYMYAVEFAVVRTMISAIPL